MLNKSEKILFSFLFALTTFGALFLLYEVIIYLYEMFGLMVIICLICFIILWVVYYLLFDVFRYLNKN